MNKCKDQFPNVLTFKKYYIPGSGDFKIKGEDAIAIKLKDGEPVMVSNFIKEEHRKK